MNHLLLLAVLLGLAGSVVSRNTQYDVCVIGGGAGGTSTAVYAKDQGLSVLMVERTDRLGGHCNTIPVTPPSPGEPNWEDVGVTIFPNTTAANIILDGTPNGRWPIDMAAYIERFAGAGSIIPANFSDSSAFIIDAGANYTLGPVTAAENPPSAAFYEAFATLEGILAEYPIFDNITINGPIPEALLGNFADFITAHNLTALMGSLFFPQEFFSGMGNFQELTTYYALRNVSPTNLLLLQGIGMYVNGGCQQIYEGIADYLGAANILYNSTVASIKRNGTSTTMNLYSGSLGNTAELQVTCDRLVIGFPQRLSNMQFMDLDATETALFSSVQTRHYYTGTVELQGPITNTTDYVAYNYDFTKPLDLPALPCWVGLNGILSYGPTALFSSSDTYRTPAEMKTLLDSQLSAIPHRLVTSHNITEIIYHEFFPYPSNAMLASSTGFFTQLANLQGHRNTYWVGSLASMAAHNMIISHAYELVTTHFPNNNPTVATKSINFTETTTTATAGSGMSVGAISAIVIAGIIAGVVATIMVQQAKKKISRRSQLRSMNQSRTVDSLPTVSNQLLSDNGEVIDLNSAVLLKSVQ